MQLLVQFFVVLWLYESQSTCDQLWKWQNDPNKWLESINSNGKHFGFLPLKSALEDSPDIPCGPFLKEEDNASSTSPMEIKSDNNSQSPTVECEEKQQLFLNQSPKISPHSPMASLPQDHSNTSSNYRVELRCDHNSEIERTPNMEWDKKPVKECRKSTAKSARRKRHDSAEREQNDHKLLDDILQSKNQNAVQNSKLPQLSNSNKIKLYFLEQRYEVIQFESELMTKFPSDHFVITSRRPHPQLTDEDIEISSSQRVVLEYIGALPELILQFKAITEVDWHQSSALKRWFCDTFGSFVIYPQTSHTILRLTRNVLKDRQSGPLLDKLIELSFNNNETESVSDDLSTEYLDLMKQLPDYLFTGDERVLYLLEFASIGWQHCLGAHSLAIKTMLQNPTWFKSKEKTKRSIPKIRILHSDFRNSIKEYMDAVHTFFKLIGEHYTTKTRGYVLLEAMRRKIDNVHDTNRVVADAVVIAMMIGDLRTNDTSRRCISVVMTSHETMESVVALLKPMMEQDHTLKMEIFSAIKRQRNTKKSKRSDLPHFTLINQQSEQTPCSQSSSSNSVQNEVNTVSTVTTVTKPKTESKHQNEEKHVIRLYFVDKKFVNSFSRALYEQDPHVSLITPSRVFKDDENFPSNLLWYLSTLDVLHYQCIEFLTILRRHTLIAIESFNYMVNDWIAQIIVIHRELWRNLREDMNVFKIIDRQLMMKYRDKLLLKDSPHSRLLVMIRNAIYNNRSAVYRTNTEMISECMDLIYDFFEFQIKITFQLQGGRVLEILNDSNFGRNVLREEELRGNETSFITGFAMVNDELESTMDHVMEPIRNTFTFCTPQSEGNETLTVNNNYNNNTYMKRNVQILSALFDSSRIFADHLFAAQKVYDCTVTTRKKTCEDIAVVLFEEKFPVKAGSPAVLEMFLEPLSDHAASGIVVERYVVKGSSKNKYKGPVKVHGFETQRIM